MNYLIWSEDHGGWRGPGEETGYVPVISAAGRYTLEQARAIYEQNSHHAVMVLAPEDSPGAEPISYRAIAASRTAIIRALLDQVDYTAGACRVNEMVGAVLPVEIIEMAKAAMKG